MLALLRSLLLAVTMTTLRLPVPRERPGRSEKESREIQRVLEATNTEHPAPQDVAALREYLRQDPALWREVGDLAQVAATDLMTRIGGGHALVTESLARGREVLVGELTQEGDSALERLLAEAVYLALLRYTNTERAYSAVVERAELSAGQASWWEKRLTGAQQRYLRASETLARVRKLRVPMVQLNIGEQQVNVAKGG